VTTDDRNNPEHRASRSREVDAALRDLNVCVERIRALIPRVHAVIDRRVETTPRRRSTRIIYAGGPSAFTRRVSEPPLEPPLDPPALSAIRDGEPRAPRPLRPLSSRQLVVAADLALAGYSKEEIGSRLRALGDPEAARAIDEAFEDPGSHLQ
jgi:hypothetical protein